MSFLHWLFGKIMPGGGTSSAGGQPAQNDPANDPNMIKVFDGYGREMFITKQEWKDSVLLGNLEKERNNPDHLYDSLVVALQDGFTADVIPYAEHLMRTDPNPSRGATILGIVYMKTNRLDDAKRILQDCLDAHGDDGVVLANLAKVHSSRGDEALAESTLWHALEVDPNQDNGLVWYVAIHRDRGGDATALDAHRRVAAIPRSWRAQLWLAQDALQSKDLPGAEILYAEALGRCPRPAPSDLLMQMSGDLGNNGYLAEIIRLVGPHFDPAFHGLEVGNNLIKANCDLGRMEAARHILNQLYTQKRHDWQETLGYWDKKLANADIEQQTKTTSEQPSIVIASIEGPLWTRDGSPFAALLPAKRDDALRIAVFGSTVLVAKVTERQGLQLSDGPGRYSRAIPLVLAERIHLTTDAAGVALIAWAQNEGFAVFGPTSGDQALCGIAGKGGKSPDYVIGVTLDATQPQWQLLARLVRSADGLCIAETQVEMASDDPGPSVDRLADDIGRLLAKDVGVRTTPAPTWYRIPTGQDLSDYLLRLEQQLAVTSMHLDFLKGGGLHGEREMLDGILQLCVRQPANQLVRMLFAQTLRQMQKVRPEILHEFKEKFNLLQRDHPLAGDVAQLIEKTLAEILGD